MPTRTDRAVSLPVLGHPDESDFSANGNLAGEPRRAISNFSFFSHRWLMSILIVTLFVALSFGLVGLPYYETNDDFTMTAIVSGTAYLDRPDEHMIFSHVFLGLLLKQLYSAVPGAPWYGIYQTVTLFIAMSVITWLVLGKSRRPIMMVGIAFCALLVTSVRPLVLMQFTTTGALLACAGVLLLMECVERWHLRKRAIACGIGAAIMFALAALVRASSANVLLIVTSLFIVSRFLPTPVRQWRKMFAQLLAVGAALAIVFAFTWVNDRYYQGEWKDSYAIIKATNVIREYRCDCVVSPLSLLMYKHVGWKNADVTVFFNWYSLDKNTFSLEKLNSLSKLMKDYWKANFDIGRAIWAVQTLVFDPSFLPLVLPGMLLIPFINRTKVPFASMVLLSIGVLSLCAFSILWLKLPMRVLVTIIMLCTLLGIRYISMSKISNVFQGNLATWKNIRRTICATILLAVIASSFCLMSQLRVQLRSMSKYEKHLNAAVQFLSPKADQLYVSWAGCLPVVVGPFSDIAETFHNFKVLSIGAMGQAPLVTNRMKEFGISDLIRQLDKENVFLISNADYNHFIEMYAAEKYGKEVVFTPVPLERQFFKVFKVKFVTPANPEKLKRDWPVGLITAK